MRALAAAAVAGALAIAGLIAVHADAVVHYLLPTSLTIDTGAGASEALTTRLVVFGVALVVVVPALALLWTLDQRSLLEEELEH